MERCPECKFIQASGVRDRMAITFCNHHIDGPELT
jgi:hypothetical protein